MLRAITVIPHGKLALLRKTQLIDIELPLKHKDKHFTLDQASFANKMNGCMTVIYALLLGQLPVACSHVKEVASVTKALLEVFLKDRPSTRHMDVVEKVLGDIAFDYYHEELMSDTVEGLDINHFEQFVNDLQSDLSMSETDKKAILRGKFAKKGMRIIKEFFFKTSELGRFMYGRIMTTKGESGKEIDCAYAFYRVDFRLSKAKIEVYNQRDPIYEFFLGAEKKIKYEDRDLDRNTQEHMMTYFRQKCRDDLVKEYPQLTADLEKTKKIEGRDEL